jgi:hypothetical protein
MKLRQLFPIAAASLLTTGCESSKQPKIFSGTTNSWYSVAASQTPFYRHGPQQGNGPDMQLPRDSIMKVIRPSFGYVKVQLQDGENGYVANEDIRPAPATLVADLDSEGDARRMLTPVLVRRARSIAEVPLSPGAKQKSGGHSFLSLLGIAVDYYMLTARRPFVAAGVASITGVAAGIILLAYGWSTAGLVLIVAGLIGVQLCLVGEYGQRLYQLSQGLPFYKLRETAGRQDDPA